MTDELKKAIESAKTEEEQQAVAEKFKDELRELPEEELASVAGGYSGPLYVYVIKPEDKQVGGTL